MRPLARIVVAALVAGLGAGVACAADPAPPSAGRVVVLPPGAPASGPAAERFAARAGAPEGALVSAPSELAGVRVRTLASRTADDDCGGPVDLARWRGRLDGAESSLLRLDLVAALDALISLELEAPCLRTPPTGADLLRLGLARADAHQLLARASRGDADARALHEGERAAALRRAAVWGVGLAAPSDLGAELARGLASAREELAVLAPATLVLVGPEADRARVDGRPGTGGAASLPPGDHLVQLGQGEVTAAAVVRLQPGETLLVWARPGGEPWDVARLEAAWGDLGRRDDVVRDALLAGLAGARGGERVYVAARPSDGVWVPTGGTLVPWHAPSASPGRAALLAGVGGAGSYSGVRGGALDGLGGLAAGGAAFVSIPVGRPAVTVSAALTGVPSRVAVAQGGGVLFRATLPVRVGVRLPVRVGPTWFTAGPEAGVHLFGPFDGEWRLSPLGGVGVELSPIAGPVAWFTRAAAAAGATRPTDGGGAYAMVGLEAGLAWRR